MVNGNDWGASDHKKCWKAAALPQYIKYSISGFSSPQYFLCYDMCFMGKVFPEFEGKHDDDDDDESNISWTVSKFRWTTLAAKVIINLSNQEGELKQKDIYMVGWVCWIISISL